MVIAAETMMNLEVEYPCMSDVDVFQLILLDQRDQLFSVIDSIDLHQCNEWGENLLHKAIAYNNTPFAKAVIRRGIDVNHQNTDGNTPLQYAAEHRNLAIAQRIIDAGGDLNICDRHGNSPLWTAVLNAKGDYRMVSLFMEHKADPYHKNKYDRCPMDIARQIEDSSLIYLLSSV